MASKPQKSELHWSWASLIILLLILLGIIYTIHANSIMRPKPKKAHKKINPQAATLSSLNRLQMSKLIEGHRTHHHHNTSSNSNTTKGSTGSKGSKGSKKKALKGQQEDTRMRLDSSFAYYIIWFVIMVLVFVITISNMVGNEMSSVSFILSFILLGLFIYFSIQYLFIFLKVKNPTLPLSSFNPLISISYV
jgi:heme/copper-type cytochrome/quinol oxidase subunit 4